MFAARVSLMPPPAGGEIGSGGDPEIALELNRLYANPMPTRKHSSFIPGVGTGSRANSQEQPDDTASTSINHLKGDRPSTNIVAAEKGEEFPLLPMSVDPASNTNNITHRIGPKHSGARSTGSTSGFEDDRLNTKYKLGWRRTLHNKRRQLADYSAIVALVGIAIMVLETELTLASVCHKTGFCSIILKSFVSLSTLVLIVLLLYYHYIETEIFKVDNSVDDWRIAVSPVRVIRILCELIICIIHPLPVEWNIKMYAISDSALKEVRVSLDVVLGVPMFLRLYLLARLLLLHSRLFTDASSRSIGALNRITFNARFVLKTLMTMCPGTVLMTFILTMFIIGSWILRICETTHNPAYYNLLNSMWLISITFLAVGYGDFAPETYCGRTVAVLSGFMGAGCTALVVAVVARKLELTRSEKHVHNFMMNTQLSKRLKDSAANVLRETWLIFKYSKLTPRPSNGKIREHQRKFLAAIKNLRKVKLEQRKITEQCHNLVDFPKVLMGISDSVVEARSAAGDGMVTLQRRMESLEKDVLEVKAHLLSIQSGLLQMMADFREATATSQASQQLQLQLLQLKSGDHGSTVLSPYDFDPSVHSIHSGILSSPSDNQGQFSDSSLSHAASSVQCPSDLQSPSDPKHSEPAWLRRHLAGTGITFVRDPKRVKQAANMVDDEQAMWSSGTSAQTVIQNVPPQQPLAYNANVPRATSAMETVSSWDPPSSTESHLPQRLNLSTANVAADAPALASALHTESSYDNVPSSSSAIMPGSYSQPPVAQQSTQQSRQEKFAEQSSSSKRSENI